MTQSLCLSGNGKVCPSDIFITLWLRRLLNALFNLKVSGHFNLSPFELIELKKYTFSFSIFMWAWECMWHACVWMSTCVSTHVWAVHYTCVHVGIWDWCWARSQLLSLSHWGMVCQSNPELPNNNCCAGQLVLRFPCHLLLDLGLLVDTLGLYVDFGESKVLSSDF